MAEWWDWDAVDGRRYALQEGLAPGVRQYECKDSVNRRKFKINRIKKS